MPRGVRRADVKSRLTPRRLSRMGWVMAQITRISKILVALMLVIWLGLWIWAGGFLNRAEDWVQGHVADVAGDMGLRIRDVIVEGRNYLSAQTLKDAIDVEPGDPLLGMDLDAMHARLMALPWIKEVSVRRALPDRLVITMTERLPLAIWLDAPGAPGVIDDAGVVLTQSGFEEFGPLLAVAGKDSEKKASDLMALLKGQPDIAVRIKKATYVSQRRWDLSIDGGTVVRLPENDPGFALARIAKAQAADKLLDQGYKSIDLRQPDRIIIENKPGDVRDLLSKDGDPV